MNFPEFWRDVVGRGTVDTEAARAVAQAAWDAALCAASARAFDGGKLRGAVEVVAGISGLHSWSEETVAAGVEGGGR